MEPTDLKSNRFVRLPGCRISPRPLRGPPSFQGRTRRSRSTLPALPRPAHASGSLIARHADARFVQECLGHSRITTTERYMYAKARPEDLERVNLAFETRSKPATKLP